MLQLIRHQYIRSFRHKKAQQKSCIMEFPFPNSVCPFTLYGISYRCNNITLNWLIKRHNMKMHLFSVKMCQNNDKGIAKKRNTVRYHKFQETRRRTTLRFRMCSTNTHTLCRTAVIHAIVAGNASMPGKKLICIFSINGTATLLSHCNGHNASFFSFDKMKSEKFITFWF